VLPLSKVKGFQNKWILKPFFISTHSGFTTKLCIPFHSASLRQNVINKNLAVHVCLNNFDKI